MNRMRMEADSGGIMAESAWSSSDFTMLSGLGSGLRLLGGGFQGMSGELGASS